MRIGQIVEEGLYVHEGCMAPRGVRTIRRGDTLFGPVGLAQRRAYQRFFAQGGVAGAPVANDGALGDIPVVADVEEDPGVNFPDEALVEQQDEAVVEQHDVVEQHEDVQTHDVAVNAQDDSLAVSLWNMTMESLESFGRLMGLPPRVDLQNQRLFTALTLVLTIIFIVQRLPFAVAVLAIALLSLLRR